MDKEFTLTEYRSLAYTLRPIKPLGTCCSNVLLETIHVEPLAGRSKAHVKQTCIVQCPECKEPTMEHITKNAIVTKTGVQHSLATLYSDIGKDLPREIRVFSDIKSAKDWIKK